MKVVIDTSDITTSVAVKALTLKEAMEAKHEARKQAKAQRLIEKAHELSLTPEQRAENERLAKVAELQEQLAALQGS
jgi:hypothetical protein